MRKHDMEALFSSKSLEWSTPRTFFQELDKEFSFNLDPCAQSHNAVCSKYFTTDDDGLAQDWSGHTAFVNPPYGRVIGLWVKKAYEAAQTKGTVVVMLIPARTDTRYWHDYVMKADEIRLIKGRLKFGGGTNSAPFPSAVVIFGTSESGAPTTPLLSAM